MSYALTYKYKIWTLQEKPAFGIGSAVHWGIEHDTDDLTEYYKEKGTFKQGQAYTFEQILSEAMIHGYLKNKEKLFAEILKDDETGEQLQLIDEQHELEIKAKLKSFLHPDTPHDFIGIIDLLLITNKGFIVIDYKTSSQTPDWDKYLEQLYRYIFLIRSEFADTGFDVYKLAIINIRKATIRQRKTEGQDEFINRLKLEYEIYDDTYICSHIFDNDSINPKLLNAYLENLSRMADTADMIDTTGEWYINYGSANGVYGKSEFWNIFYQTPGAEVLYGTTDKIYDKELQQFVNWRPCKEIDMQVINRTDILRTYEQFKIQALAYFSVINDADELKLYKHLEKNFYTDRELLKQYWETLTQELLEEQTKNE